MNRKIKVFIIISVMLNVLFIGLFFGSTLKHKGFGHEKPMAAILSKAQIPADRSSLIEKQINSIFENGRGSRKEMEEMRGIAFNILAAENFDDVAYQAQMDKMFDMRNQQRKNMSEEIKNLAKQLDQKERLALAEILRDMPKKR